MCGIVGIINFSDNNDFLEKKNLLKMRDSMTHRGPDDCGNYNDKYVGFGQRRLSILDLSRQGRQPMKYKDKIIIFNGEIYNFQAIKEDLERLGDKFISKTDTEVILHAFEHWGEKCLEKFNGMFAFAIWDRKRRKLFIARDRLGVKPLYYFKPNKNVLVFASEIKAICAYNKYQPEIAKENLFDFFRYSFVPGDKTLFKEIKELLPGHFIKGEATQNNLKLNFKKYWDIPRYPVSENFSNALKKIEALLKESVQLRLIADVPVGVQLSGGVDSSIVSYFAAQNSPQINSISVDAVAEGLSEKNYAEFVSKKLNLKPHNIKLNFSEFYQELDQLIYIYEEPTQHANSIGIYLLSKYAKENVTVLLSGEGADELFCGYDRYYQLKIYDLVSKIPTKYLRKKTIEKFLPGCYFNYLTNLQRKPYRNFYIKNVINAISQKDITEIFNSDIIQMSNKYLDEILAEFNSQDFLNNASHYDLKNYLVSLLTRQDKMSMAWGIENRVPFLDYRIVEYVAALPSKYKVKGKITKFILKKLAEKYFPKDFVYRSKMGFGVPIKVWLSTPDGKKLVDSLLSKSFFEIGLFNPNQVKLLVKEFKEGKEINYGLLWTLIAFKKWHNIFISQENEKITL